MAWDKMTTRVRGASTFWRGLGKVVPIIQNFFRDHVKFSFLGYNTEAVKRSRRRTGKKICGGMSHMATP